jgi:hypothetical protein
VERREIKVSGITVPRRDPRIHAAASRDDLELLLADSYRDAEMTLARELRDRIHFDEISDAAPARSRGNKVDD